MKRKDYKKMDEGSDIGLDESFVDSDADESVSEEAREDSICEEEQLDIWMNMSEEDFQKEVNEAMEEENELLLMQLLEVQERRCQNLQKILKSEQSKEEKAKRKRLSLIAEKFKKLKKEESGLSRSLATSRNSTPNTSPDRKKKDKSPKGRTVSKKRTTTTKERPKELNQNDSPKTRGKRELSPSNLLDSLIELKQGRAQAFSELVCQAMTTTNKFNNRNSKINEDEIYLPNFEEGGFRNFKCDRGDKTSKIDTIKPAGANAESHRDNQAGEKQHKQVNSPEGYEQLINLLQDVKLARGDNGAIDSVITELKQARTGKDKEKVTGKEEEQKTKGKNEKLLSGKTAKPDEVDIKKPVKFAHEKLDPTFVKRRIFDKLNFATLVAGEMELILLKGVSTEERLARAAIIKTMAYHKTYLQDDELRIGYDTILKKVEQEEMEWGPKMAEDLNRFYEARGQAQLREQLQIKPPQPAAGEEKNNKKEPGEDPDNGGDSKIIYCMEFNKGTCSEEKSHVGKWKGKKCTKWHICRACIKHQELSNHPEGDVNCPNSN